MGKNQAIIPSIEELDGLVRGDPESLRARRLALQLSPSVVSLSSYRGADRLFVCSGAIIRWDGTDGIILTSASLIRRTKKGRDYVPDNVEVKVQLFDDEVLCGEVLNYDLHHNIAVIKVESKSELQVAKIDAGRWPCFGDEVVVIGRDNEANELDANRGKVRDFCVRYDCLELLELSCKMTKSGIGGPVINPSDGCVIGINFYDAECTPFLPIAIVARCLRHFDSYGRVVRPWMGLKVESLDELQIGELDKINQKFRGIQGVIVMEAVEGSPAKGAGICSGDIITHCGGLLVRSVPEFTAALLDTSPKYMGDPASLTYSRSKRKKGDDALGTMVVKVVVRRTTTCVTEARSIITKELGKDCCSRWPVPDDSAIKFPQLPGTIPLR